MIFTEREWNPAILPLVYEWNKSQLHWYVTEIKSEQKEHNVELV